VLSLQSNTSHSHGHGTHHGRISRVKDTIQYKSYIVIDGAKGFCENQQQLQGASTL